MSASDHRASKEHAEQDGALAELIEASRQATIMQCIAICEKQRLGYSGGAPDYQTGTEDCAEALKTLLLTKGEPVSWVSLLDNKPNVQGLPRDCVPGIGPLPKPMPPEGRLECSACGPLPPSGRHNNWVCQFLGWLDSR